MTIFEPTTGFFEISVPAKLSLSNWKLEKTRESMRRHAMTIFADIQTPGAAYVFCMYPVTEERGLMILRGFCALAQWQDCGVGDAYCCNYDRGEVIISDGRVFRLEDKTIEHQHYDQIYIYRRLE